MGENESRGSLTFFTTYRPTIQTAIFSSPFSPTSQKDETLLTDQVSYNLETKEKNKVFYNYNGQDIPPQALRLILQQSKVKDYFTSYKEGDDIGKYSGLVFVSERHEGLETLHFSIRYDMDDPKVFQFSDLYDTSSDVRMEDSGCFAGDYLVYVSTKQPAPQRRQPWTAVYKTNLETRETTRLTPQAIFQAIVEGLPELINVPDRKGWKLLSYVARNGYFDEVKCILKHNPNSLRKADEDGSFPIHKAVAGGHVNIVKELLLHCPEALQYIDREGRNLVVLATLHKKREVLLFEREN